jgi:hypothetical protein
MIIFDQVTLLMLPADRCCIAIPPFESQMVMLSKMMSLISVSVFEPNLIACELDFMVTLWTWCGVWYG